MGKRVYIRSPKERREDKGRWSEKKRIEAITTYHALNSLAETSRVLDIPIKTLESWKISSWWKDISDQLIQEKDNSLCKEVTNIVDKTLNAIVDRVENGDYLFDARTGEIRRIPVKADALNRIASHMVDKRLLLNKQPTKIVHNESNMQGKLEQLSKAFESFVRIKTIEQVDEETYTVKDNGDIINGFGDTVGKERYLPNKEPENTP